MQDPEGTPASGAVDKPEQPSSETSDRPSSSFVRYIEDEEDVRILRNGVLVDTVPKDSDRLPSWCRWALKYETPELSPKRSCSCYGDDPFIGFLKAHYGITVEKIQRSVQENLNKLDRVGPATNLKYLNHAIIRDVLDSVNFSIAKAFKMPHAPKEMSSRELIHIVTTMLDAHAICETGTILVVEENDELDKAIASTTGEAMTAAICAAETCFDENKKAKSLLASMKKAIRILTGKNASFEHTQLCQMEEKPLVSCDCRKETAGQKASQTHREIVQRLNSEDFRSQATKAISDILIAEMQAQSSDTPSVQSILPTASLIVDTVVAEIMSAVRSDSGESSLVKSEMAEKLSSDEFQATVAKEVSQVLLKLAPSFTGPVMSDNPQGFSPASDSAASSVVVTVLDGVRCLVNSTSCDDLTQDLNLLVWSTTCDMFSRLQLNLKHFFRKLSSRQRKAIHSASAKQAIIQVLLYIQLELELSISSKLHEIEEIKDIKDIIYSLIDSVEMEKQRPLSSLSVTSQESWSSCSEESLSEVSMVKPEVSAKAPMAADTLVLVNIDLDDLPQDEASACVPHETVVRVVNSITSKLGLESEESSTPHSQDHLTSVWKRLEKALAQGHIKSSSHDLIEDIYQLLLKGRQTVAAGRSASDSALAAMRQAQNIPQEAMASQIVGMFAQESVRGLFLPCFKLPSSWKSGPGAPLRSATASVSCPGGLSSMARKGEDHAAESLSQILAEVLQVAMDAMVTDVMNILSLTTRSLMDMETLMEESGFPDEEFAFNTPDFGLVDDLKRADSQDSFTDYSGLVAMLMIRLLSKLQNEDSLSDDILDQCRELINKVLSELTATFGVSKTDTCPAGVNICKVFKVIYNDLLCEYGSKSSVLGALEIEDPLVQKTVVRSLISEIKTDVTNNNVALSKKDKRKTGCFQFLPNMKKIKSWLKRNKSDQQKNANTDGTTAFSTSDSIAGAESSACVVPLDEEPHSMSGSPEKRRSLFTRIRSFLKRKSSDVSPAEF